MARWSVDLIRNRAQRLRPRQRSACALDRRPGLWPWQSPRAAARAAGWSRTHVQEAFACSRVGVDRLLRGLQRCALPWRSTYELPFQNRLNLSGAGPKSVALRLSECLLDCVGVSKNQPKWIIGDDDARIAWSGASHCALDGWSRGFAGQSLLGEPLLYGEVCHRYH